MSCQRTTITFLFKKTCHCDNFAKLWSFMAEGSGFTQPVRELPPPEQPCPANCAELKPSSVPAGSG